MKQSLLSKENLHSVAIGYFGWVIGGNIAFLLFFFQFIQGSVIIYADLFSGIIWLFTIISMFVLLLSKKYWVSIGIAFAFLINILLWMALPALMHFYYLPQVSDVNLYELSIIITTNHHSFSFSDLIFFAGIPLPVGILIGFN